MVFQERGEGGGARGVCTGNFGGGGEGREAPFTVKMSPLFGENALKSMRATKSHEKNTKKPRKMPKLYFFQADEGDCNAGAFLGIIVKPRRELLQERQFQRVEPCNLPVEPYHVKETSDIKQEWKN